MKALYILWFVVCVYSLVDIFVLYKLRKNKYKDLEKVQILNFIILRIFFYIYIFKNYWNHFFSKTILIRTVLSVYFLILPIVIIFLINSGWFRKDKKKTGYAVIILSEYFIIHFIYMLIAHYFFSRGNLDVSQYTVDFIY